jgi:hypothetical protein
MHETRYNIAFTRLDGQNSSRLVTQSKVRRNMARLETRVPTIPLTELDPASTTTLFQGSSLAARKYA